MKRIIIDFIRRGLAACGFGPMVLAAVYLILQKACGLQTLTVGEVCRGIVSLAALAFISGGMNAIYRIERLPLMAAIGIHGGVLYISYLAVYLVNGWLQSGPAPVLVFTLVFIPGYAAVWAVIYFVTKRSTDRINKQLRHIQTE